MRRRPLRHGHAHQVLLLHRQVVELALQLGLEPVKAPLLSSLHLRQPGIPLSEARLFGNAHCCLSPQHVSCVAEPFCHKGTRPDTLTHLEAVPHLGNRRTCTWAHLSSMLL